MQKTTKVLIAAALSAGLMSSAMHAEDKWYDKINASGYLAGGYQANLNGLTSNTNLIGRAFDQKANQFDGAGALNITSKGSMGDMGEAMATLELFYGPQFATVTTDLPVEQGFVTLTHGGWTMKGGKMNTFLGTEVIDYPGNWNFSRSLLFGQIPFYHHGISIGSSWEGLGWMAQISNSQNNVALAGDYAGAPQMNSSSTDAKDLGAQFTYSIMGWNWTLNYLHQSILGKTATQHTINVLTNYQVMEGLNFAAEYLYKGALQAADTFGAGTPAASAKAQGYAAYLSYDLGAWVKNLSVAPRFEQWWTPDPFYATSAATETDEATLSLKYKTGQLTHFLEYRHDFGNASQFANPAGGTLYNQDSLSFGGEFSF
jgi:hypothetical protein